MTKACVRSCARRTISSWSSSAVRVSRLPVGSSARTRSRLVHERAGDGDALLLAAGELRRPVVGPVAEPERFEQGAGAGRRLRERPAADQRRHRHVFERAELGQQVVELEDEPDRAVAEVGERLVVLGEHVRSVVADGAARRAVERAEEVEQRALPRPALPHDRDDLARRGRRASPRSTSSVPAAVG